jgi:hypothetical protein
MALFLQNQIETYARDVDALLTREHQAAMVCREVEEVIEIGLLLFEAYERVDASWRSHVSRAKSANMLELTGTGEMLKSALGRLSDCRIRTLDLVHRLERMGYEVDGTMRYRALSPMSFDDRPLDIPLNDDKVAALTAHFSAEEWNRHDDQDH